LRLVVLDDNPDDRANVRQLLIRAGERRFGVEEAETAEVGVPLIQSGAAPYCLLLDNRLPDAEASEVLAALTREHVMTLCPVVVLTGAVPPGGKDDLMRAGAQEVLEKDGLSGAELVRAIDHAHERWTLTQRGRSEHV
jgi:CheY-like chemotaxis protein